MNKKNEQLDLTIGFLAALIARAGETGIVLSSDELRQNWERSWSYRVEGNNIRITFDA